MLLILTLIITAVLGTPVITLTALIFLFRKMTEYIYCLCDKVDKKKAKAELTKGWGD